MTTARIVSVMFILKHPDN